MRLVPRTRLAEGLRAKPVQTNTMYPEHQGPVGWAGRSEGARDPGPGEAHARPFARTQVVDAAKKNVDLGDEDQAAKERAEKATEELKPVLDYLKDALGDAIDKVWSIALPQRPVTAAGV